MFIDLEGGLERVNDIGGRVLVNVVGFLLLLYRCDIDYNQLALFVACLDISDLVGCYNLIAIFSKKSFYSEV